MCVCVCVGVYFFFIFCLACLLFCFVLLCLLAFLVCLFVCGAQASGARQRRPAGQAREGDGGQLRVHEAAKDKPDPRKFEALEPKAWAPGAQGRGGGLSGFEEEMWRGLYAFYRRQTLEEVKETKPCQ